MWVSFGCFHHEVFFTLSNRFGQALPGKYRREMSFQQRPIYARSRNRSGGSDTTLVIKATAGLKAVRAKSLSIRKCWYLFVK
jgi:hypothetical protein